MLPSLSPAGRGGEGRRGCGGLLGCRRLEDGGSIFFPLAGRGGEGEEGECAAGVDLLWMGSVEVGLRLRLPLSFRRETARTRRWWLGEVSPPMVVQRLRFRRSCRMDLAVLQRSVSAIEPHLLLGMRKPFLLPLRWCSGGAGVWMRWALRWLGWRTCRDFFVFLLFARVLFALCPGQVAFGLLLVYGCVCVRCACTPTLF